MALSAREMPIHWIQRYSDILFAFILVTVVVMFIIPLPTIVLDIFITCNIAFALTVLLVSIYTGEPLEFSVFPSLLLFATLFRLALNVSTTRLILGQADAGRMIFAFGDFVVGGNYVVGFIIFLILVVIQFIVITKGAERVAEVAARFTLDAMPGKQMSIDADLNSGLINEEEARTERKKIRQEADFYGAMDGASKFVKGDAIAGIVITLINIVAGLVIGVIQQGMALEEALQTYALLTVGDGLVSQIPALLIATSTGMVVTRAAGEANLGQDLSRQMLSQPKALLVVASILFLLGLSRGLPTFPLFILSAVIGGMYFIFKAEKDKEEELEEEAEEELEPPSRPTLQKEDYKELIRVDPVEMEFGYNLLPLVLPEQGGDFLERITLIRKQVATELGMIIPPVRVLDNMQIDPNTYSIKLKGMEVARFQIVPNHFLAMDSGNVEQEMKGVKVAEPAFGLPALWIPEDKQEEAEIAGYTVVDPPSIMSTHLTEVLKEHAAELLGRREVKEIMETLKEDYSAVVNELIPDQMTLGEIQKVLQFLLEEEVSIRDQVTILETLADWAGQTKDPVVLTEYVRQALQRHISSKYQENEVMQALTLTPQLEADLGESLQQSENGSFLNLDPGKARQILDAVIGKFNEARTQGKQPVILTNPILRFHLKRLLDRGQSKNQVPVLSYNEIDPGIDVRSVGVIRVETG